MNTQLNQTEYLIHNDSLIRTEQWFSLYEIRVYMHTSITVFSVKQYLKDYIRSYYEKNIYRNYK